MKILFTGGGTGGHFYPIIAVVEALHNLIKEKRLLDPKLIFMSDSKYDADLLQASGLIFKKVYAGKMRRYFSLLNITDLFKTAIGILKAIWSVYSDMPDVIFGKGGYVSFPTLLAAKIFGVPVIIHESDTIPGKVNKWAGKFAKKIAISFPEAAKYFSKEKTALIGTPIRKNILGFTPEEGRELFNIKEDIPTILILGGSQGCQKINDTVIDIAQKLVESFHVIHQCGANNEKDVKNRLKIVLENSPFKNRYHVYSYLNDSLLRNASSIASIVVSREGCTAIYEISAWGLPSILIPLKNSAQDHQKENAYCYARLGAANIIEEDNLSPHILFSEIQRLIAKEEEKKSMKEAAKKFAKPDAAKKIAQEIINLALEHAQ